MIEDVFLTYANCSLRDIPEKLREIFSIIASNIKIDFYDAEEVIAYICELSELTKPQLVLSWHMEKGPTVIGDWSSHTLAYHAVVGYRDHYYHRIYKEGSPLFTKDPDLLEEVRREAFDCELRGINKKEFGEDLCEEAFALKCYECHQLKFARLLQDVVDGKEYSEIEDIDYVLWGSSVLSAQKMDRVIGESLQTTPFKETLQTNASLLMGFRDYVDSEYGNTHHAFNDYLNNIMYFCLTEFLLNNDRRKLKKCPYCHKFFRADRINQQRCKSDECRKAYDRSKKRKQRERDPVKYY